MRNIKFSVIKQTGLRQLVEPLHCIYTTDILTEFILENRFSPKAGNSSGKVNEFLVFDGTFVLNL